MDKINIFINDLFKFRLNKKLMDKISYITLVSFILLVSLLRFNLEIGYESSFFLNYLNIKVYVAYYIFFLPFLYILIDTVKNKRLEYGIPDLMIYCYIMFCLISTLLSGDKYTSIFGVDGRKEGMIVVLEYFMIYISTRRLTKENLKNITKILCYIVIFQNVLGICQAFLNILSRWGHMANGLGGNPNFFGSFNCMFCILTLGLYLYKNNKLYLITCILSYTGLLLSESSGPFFSFCLVLFIMLIYVIIKKTKINQMIIMISVFVFLFPLIQLGNTYINNKYYGTDIKMPLIYNDIEYLAKKGFGQYLSSQVDEDIQDYDISTGRMWIWQGGIKLFKKHPFFGTGLDTFRVYSSDAKFLANKAHNNYLEIAVDTGVFSLVCYIGFILSLTIIGIKSKNKLAYIFLASFTVYGIQIFMNISTILVAPYYYILAGLLIQIINNKKVIN